MSLTKMRWTVIGFLLLTFAAGCTCQTMSPDDSMNNLMGSSDFDYELINPTQSNSGFASTDNSWYISGLEDSDSLNSGILYGSMSDEWSASTYKDGIYGSMTDGWPTGSFSDGMYESMTDSWPTGSFTEGMYGSMTDGWPTGSLYWEILYETPIHPNFTVGVMAKSATEHVIALYCKFYTDSNLKYKITWRADHDVIYQGPYRPGKVLEFNICPGNVLKNEISGFCPGIVLKKCENPLKNEKMSLNFQPAKSRRVKWRMHTS